MIGCDASQILRVKMRKKKIKQILLARQFKATALWGSVLVGKPIQAYCCLHCSGNSLIFSQGMMPNVTCSPRVVPLTPMCSGESYIMVSKVRDGHRGFAVP